MGRPKSELPTRDKAVMFYLTPSDAEWFSEYADDFGFKSRSQLITAIMERLRLCGMSPAGCFRMGSNIQNLSIKRNPEKFQQSTLDFHTIKLRPFPAIPEDDEISPEILQATIKELQKQLKELKNK